jgi:16S rRNA (guanine966-N2)-methyltransferase
MHLRPTPDAMRERAFAVLGERLQEVRFLDLFAGTGAVGLEALSRGAAEVVMVEQHRAAARLIAANRDALQIKSEQARVLVRPVARALRELARHGQQFQLAWSDPPFDQWRSGFEALVTGFELEVLAAGATACLECPVDAALHEMEQVLEIERELQGGASRVVLLRRYNR